MTAPSYPVTNTQVVTPNGPGICQGLLREDGYIYVMVRHPRPITESHGGRPWRINAATTLWVYEPEEVR